MAAFIFHDLCWITTRSAGSLVYFQDLRDSSGSFATLAAIRDGIAVTYLFAYPFDFM